MATKIVLHPMIAVVGSRSFQDYAFLEEKLNELQNIGTIISGGAAGADSLAALYARHHHIDLIELKPDWNRYGRGAGLERNTEIVSRADRVIAFWDGESKGTIDSINKAKQSGKPVTVYRV